MYAGYERNSETFQKGSKFHDTFISVLHPHILEHWPGSLSFCWLLCFCTYNYFNPPAHRRMFKLHRTWTNMTSRTDRTSSTNSNSTASSDEPHTDSDSANCTITRGPKIHVLQPSSPTKFVRNPLNIFNRRKKSEQVALLIGTEQSGKRSLMESINYMDTELEIISLSNDIAISNYHNFLYGVNSIIFVMDSAKLSVEYLDRVKSILTSLQLDQEVAPDAGKRMKLLLLLNKSDLVCVENVSAIERYLELSALNVRYLILPTSGASGYGVSEGINWLLM